MMKNAHQNTLTHIYTMCSLMQVKGSGISFFDVTSNVSLENIVITDTTTNGLTLMPMLDRHQLTNGHMMYPTFWICDINTDMFIRHGEEYRFFPMRATDWKHCVKRFETEEKYSIVVTMKAASDDGVLAAEFYEGTEAVHTKMINRFSGAQVGRAE